MIVLASLAQDVGVDMVLFGNLLDEVGLITPTSCGSPWIHVFPWLAVWLPNQTPLRRKVLVFGTLRTTK